MIRVRFHGRGGHGVKTASRILGTAAFLSGYEAQDSPVYGAERRGAVVVAFARIDERPILERGIIDAPDLIVVADETLLADQSAGVLAGGSGATAIVINATPAMAANLAQQHGLTSPLIADDISARTRALLGTASALSAGLGAAAARVIGIIPAERLLEAVREEVSALGVSPDIVDGNLAVARIVFESLMPISFKRAESLVTPSGDSVRRIGYDEPFIGAPSILAPGNAAQRLTGSWRVERPEIDYDVCTRCRLCYLGCPEGAIKLNAEGFPVIDYDHCKGCMICAQLCPLHGIGRSPEVHAW